MHLGNERREFKNEQRSTKDPRNPENLDLVNLVCVVNTYQVPVQGRHPVPRKHLSFNEDTDTAGLNISQNFQDGGNGQIPQLPGITGISPIRDPTLEQGAGARADDLQTQGAGALAEGLQTQGAGASADGLQNQGAGPSGLQAHCNDTDITFSKAKKGSLGLVITFLQML